MPIVPNTVKKETVAPKKNTIAFDLSQPIYSLSDLILPAHTLNELKRAISLREHQSAVFEEWGFKSTSMANRVQAKPWRHTLLLSISTAL